MTQKRYRVAHLGLGSRGTIHADTFLELDDRYELVGLCELDKARMAEYCNKKDLNPAVCYSDAEEMLAATKPDIFCFITQPNTSRLQFVNMAVRHGVKAIALEKPMATSLDEATQIITLCRKHNIKGVISHQQKYLTSLQKMKEIANSGVIGEVYLITASCQAWLSQLGTHFVDYVLWANDYRRAEWVVGHVHGKELLSDHHPSPNYVMGQIGFANGVRAIVEFGKLSASHMEADKFWVDNRLTVYGSMGYAWGETDGRWGALINGQKMEEQGESWGVQQSTSLQPLYFNEFADWLDDKITDHSCSLARAYHGYEIMEALCISAMDNVRVDLPLATTKLSDMFERMRNELPDCPELDKK